MRGRVNIYYFKIPTKKIMLQIADIYIYIYLKNIFRLYLKLIKLKYYKWIKLTEFLFVLLDREKKNVIDKNKRVV